jgi:hypothetical protein
MADDVKVKFGGDFTDVSKGASDAVSKAGGALGSWFSDFSKSTEASILSAMSLSAIFGKLVENMSATLKTANGIDMAFKRFGNGGSSKEFQLVARYGAEVGVSMEAVGRTMNYFAKVQEAAVKGSKSHASVLKELKFTDDEVSKGKISAIEVLRRLSDEYDRTGNEALSAQRSIQLFGPLGEQLSAIYKNGKISLDEFTKATKTMSDATVENLAKTQKSIDKLKRSFMDIGAAIAGRAGKESSMVQGRLIASEVMLGNLEKTGGTPEQEGKSIGSQIYSELKDDTDALRYAMGKLKSEFTGFLVPQDIEDTANEAIKTIQRLYERDSEKRNKQPEGPPLLSVVRVMAASSLQEIGGGDVNSILSGTYQSSMLDAANKTADNTSKLVNAGANQPLPKAANVAK